MSTVWFTSDIHFSHRLLAIDIRRFDSVEEHDETIIENINKCVRKDDSLWILGDLSLKKPDVFAPLFRRLKGNKYIIWGNYDYGWGGNREAYKFGKAYAEMGVLHANDYGRRKIDGHNVMLSHFPYSGDHSLIERYDEYRLRNMGNPVLHGHTHEDKVISTAGVNTLQIHIGLDAWKLQPVEINTVVELLRLHT